MRTKSSSVRGVELHPDREAALELGDQVRRLADVEGAGGEEEDVVGAHHAVLGRDRRPLDDRQQVPLHPLAGDVRPAAAFAPGDLVDLVEEDDAALLHPVAGLPGHLLAVDQLVGLLLDEDLDGRRPP
jgi:hypothetical protein